MDLKPTPTSPKLKKTEDLERLYQDKELKELHRPRNQSGRFFMLLVTIVLGGFAGWFGAWYFNNQNPISISRDGITYKSNGGSNAQLQKRADLNEKMPESSVGIFEKKDTSSITDPISTVYAQSAQLSSGILVTSDGWIVAPKWSVPDLKKTYVAVTNDGLAVPIDQVIGDPSLPIYYLKIAGQNYRAIDFIDNDKVDSLDEVLYLRHETGQEIRLGAGMVIDTHYSPAPAATDRILSTEAIFTRVLIQESLASAYQGAAVINYDGKLVGLIVSDVWPTSQVVAAGAIRAGLNSLLKNGAVVRAEFGAHYIDLSTSRDISSIFSQRRQTGAYIYGDREDDRPAVISQSPAAVAGLKKGDIIIQVNNTKLDTGTTLTDVVQGYSPGEELKLTVLRDTKEIPLTLKLGSLK
jgi:S1-C subfamily serine protease